MRESSGEAVRVPDVAHAVYRALLDYLLSDYLACQLASETLLELMMLSNAYGITRLEQMCAHKLAATLDATNVSEVGRCAALIGAHHLHRAADKFTQAQAQCPQGGGQTAMVGGGGSPEQC